MPKEDIIYQLLHMLSSEHSDVQGHSTSMLSNLAQYSEHELALKLVSNSDGCSDDMRALMPKHDIISQLVHMLSSENCEVQHNSIEALSDFAQYGEHDLAWKLFNDSDGCSEDIRASMPKDAIISQLVYMLSSEDSDIQGAAFLLSDFVGYGEHELST